MARGDLKPYDARWDVLWTTAREDALIMRRSVALAIKQGWPRTRLALIRVRGT